VTVPHSSPDLTDPKTVLLQYLQRPRDTLLWKLEGLSEREARMPRTPTGNSLLGVVKHCLNVEAGYFGPTFGREFPTPEELVSLEDYEQDMQADWYAREDETKDGIVDLYRRVQAFANETIEQLALDARGQVAWWPPERRETTLQRIIVHVINDVAQHAGHADVMRELHDRKIGLRPEAPNLPDDAFDWDGYVAKLTEIANRF
jgi:uncharacterized damage-inducible protein DinB